MAVKYAASPTQLATSLDAVSLSSAFGAGSEFALILPVQGTPFVTWQTVYSAAPSTVTVLLQSSLDGSSWSTIDTSTNTAGEIRTVSGSFAFLRINNSAVTGGAGKTLTATFIYTNRITVGSTPDAQYVTAATDPNLTAERVLTDTATVTWDFSTTGQAKANSSGSGDVVGPGSSTDNAIVRFDGTTGKLLQDSLITLSDLSSAKVTAAVQPPAAAATTTVGTALFLTASNAVAGTSVAGADLGGAVQITAGNAARLTSGNANGGSIALNPGTGVGTGVAGSVYVTAGQLLNGDGSAALPAYGFSNSAGTGFYRNGASIVVTSAGTAVQVLAGGASAPDLTLRSDSRLGFSSTTDPTLAADTYITRDSARVFILGAHTGSASAQTLRANDSTSATVAGAALTIKGGAGTSGVANGGNLNLSGGDKSSTGTVGNVVVTQGQLLNLVGLATAPSYSFTAAPTLGMALTNSNAFLNLIGSTEIVFNVFGGNQAALINGSFNVGSNILLGFSSSSSPDSAIDTSFYRVAAGVAGVGTSSANQQLSLEKGGHRVASGKITLTEAGGAETVVVVTTATTEMTGGRFNYTVRATDGTDLVARSGDFNFVCINAATAVTATLGASAETNDSSVLIATGGATLTYAIAADVATANKMKITFNIDSSLVVSAASITWTMTLNGPGTVSTS